MDFPVLFSFGGLEELQGCMKKFFHILQIRFSQVGFIPAMKKYSLLHYRPGQGAEGAKQES